MRKALYLIPALALAMTPAVMAQTATTFPNTLPATFIGNSWPFNNTSTAGYRTQFVYDGSMLPSAGPVLISRLRFRRSSLTATNTGLLNGVTMSLSTSPSKWATLSTTFASNVGADVQVIFKGNLVCNATAWYIDIKLTTPFLYDPSKGALCFDFVRGPTPASGNTYPGAPGYVQGTATAPFKANRVYGSPTAATGSVNTGTTASNGYASCCEVSWLPAKGLYSSFDADKTSGPSPLTVQFTDKTYSSAGPVKTWAWDLDGDSKIDSRLQNPKFTYPKAGFDAQYDVTLTTTDGTHPASKQTVKAFITVDPSDAFAVNFGSGSTNKPVQTPVEVSPYSSTYSSSGATRGMYFQAPTQFVITGFEAPNTYTTTKQTHQTVTCYVIAKRPPEYASVHTPVAADIKFHGTGPSNTVLKPAKPIVVAKGQWVCLLGACHELAATTSNRNSYGSGAFKSTVLGMPITLNRLIMQANHRANKGIFGIAGNGSGSIGRVLLHVVGNNTVPSMTTVGVPSLGTTPSIDVSAKVSGAQGGVILLSAGRQAAPVPTPFGNLLINASFFGAVFVPTGTGKVPFPVPSHVSLKGVIIDFQSMVYNLTTQTYGMTNGTEWFLGK
jgi:PKD repeat protein